MPKSPILWSPQSPGLRSLDTLWSRRSQTLISARPEPGAPGSHFPREDRAAGGTEVPGCGSYSSCLALPGRGPAGPWTPGHLGPPGRGFWAGGPAEGAGPWVIESQPPRLERPDWLPRSGRPSPPGGDSTGMTWDCHQGAQSAVSTSEVAGRREAVRGSGAACGVTRSWECRRRESQPQCEGVSGGNPAHSPLPVHRCVFGWGIRRVENNSEVPDPGSWEKLKRKLRRLAVGVGL